jgi:hypothetical protein
MDGEISITISKKMGMMMLTGGAIWKWRKSQL